MKDFIDDLEGTNQDYLCECGTDCACNCTHCSCNSNPIDTTSNRPYIDHSLKDEKGVTDNIKHKSQAFYNTNDTGMQHQ